MESLLQGQAHLRTSVTQSLSSVTTTLILLLGSGAAFAQVVVPPPAPLGTGTIQADCPAQNYNSAVWTGTQDVSVKLNAAAMANLFPGNEINDIIDATKQAIHRWKSAGLPLNVTFDGLAPSTQTTASYGEILIVALERSIGPDPRLAEATSDPGANRSTIRFFLREAAPVGSPAGPLIPWAPLRAPPTTGDFEYQAVLMHELGHSFGLCGHYGGSDKSVVFDTYDWADQRYGPYKADMARLKDIYSGIHSIQRRVRPWASSNALQNWAQQPVIGTVHMDVSDKVGADWDTSPIAPQFVISYTRNNNAASSSGVFRHIGWMRSTDGEFSYPWTQHSFYSSTESWYGTDIDGVGGIFMMTFVDPNYGSTDSLKPRVLFSSNAASTFSWRDVASVDGAVGTPAVRYLYGNTWLLCYAKRGGAYADYGRLVCHHTADNGTSWSSPFVLSNTYRAMGDVALSSTSTGPNSATVRLSFVWDNDDSSKRFVNRSIGISAVNSSFTFPSFINVSTTKALQGPAAVTTNSYSLKTYLDASTGNMVSERATSTGNWESPTNVGTSETVPAAASSEGVTASQAYIYSVEED